MIIILKLILLVIILKNQSSYFKPVWNKEFILLDRKYGNTSNSQIKITEQLKVGLKFYNDLINQFSNELDLPVDSV